jgi:hypothetical protein
MYRPPRSDARESWHECEQRRGAARQERSQPVRSLDSTMGGRCARPGLWSCGGRRSRTLTGVNRLKPPNLFMGALTPRLSRPPRTGPSPGATPPPAARQRRTPALGVTPLVLATGAGANARKSIGITVFSGTLASSVLSRAAAFITSSQANSACTSSPVKRAASLGLAPVSFGTSISRPNSALSR